MRPAVHRTIIAVDIDGFGDPTRTLPHQLGTRAGLYKVVGQALHAAGVPWSHCHVEDRGDAVFILVPPDIPKEPIVDVAPQALARAVRAHNHISHEQQRVRLRMAVHAGEVAFDQHGVTSTAITTAFRLLDAPPAKHALRDSSGVVALIVSSRVFDDIVRHSATLQPATFRPIPIAVKETRTTAWIALPDQPYPVDPTVLDRTADDTNHSRAAADPGDNISHEEYAEPAKNQAGEYGVVIHGGVIGYGQGITIGAVTGDHASVGQSSSDLSSPAENEQTPTKPPTTPAQPAPDLLTSIQSTAAVHIIGDVTATSGATAIGSIAGTVHIHPLPTPVTPRQLPSPPAGFVGRVEQLAHLDRALTAVITPIDVSSATGTDPRQGMGSAVFISAIGGAGGIGKTWLVLHWAHHNIGRFPDGQLFIDLRGFSPNSNPIDPLTALYEFLVALGIASTSIPASLDARAALYRSKIAGKRMLIVLDNAATTDQVEPLLPGTATCTVLVTGRKKLAALITRYGARHLQLDILTRDDAHSLLIERLGQARVTAETHAASELIRLCGRYPLALAIITSHAHTRPHITLAEFAAEVRDLGLDKLDNDDPAASLPTVLSWSMRGLTAEQCIGFALLGLAPGPDIGLLAAASLTGLAQRHANRLLDALEEASLLVRQHGTRYVMHDLIRAYATNAAHDLPTDVQHASLRRVLDFYTYTSDIADHLLDPHRTSIWLDPLAPDPQPFPALPDLPAALAWFDTEHANLLAAQRTAITHAWHHTAWQLAWNLTTFHYRRGHRHDRLAVSRTALDAAAHMPDPAARIRAHRLSGRAYANLGHYQEAIEHLHQAVALAQQHHNPTEQAHAHQALSGAWQQYGDSKRALEHSTYALDLYRTVNQPVWEADALNDVGWDTAQLGDYDTARSHCQAALALQQHHHNPIGEANTLDSLGYIEHHTGHHNRAISYYQQALILYRDLGNIYRVANTLNESGHIHKSLGHHDHAKTVWQEALQLYQQQGRDYDAKQVQRQLDALDKPNNKQPPEPQYPQN